MRRRYIQDRKTGKLVPAEEYFRQHQLHHIQEDIKPFVSHVDGTLITSRKELREHNKRNNVVQATGGDQEFLKKRADLFQGRSYDKEARLDAVKFAVELHEQGRSKADIAQMIENYQKSNR